MPYAQLKQVVIVSLIAYASIAVCIQALQKQDAYPFFSWNLFSVIPNVHTAYTMKIISMNGVSHNPPLSFDTLSSFFQNINASPPEYLQIVQQLGSALENKSSRDNVVVLRQNLERMFANTKATYQITRIEYDPLEYWHTHQYRSETILETFTAGKQL